MAGAFVSIRALPTRYFYNFIIFFKEIPYFASFYKEAYTNYCMKRYVPILIGIVALCAVLYVGSTQTGEDKVVVEAEETTELTSFKGTVTRAITDGEAVLQYSFDMPLTATATVERDGALVKVTDADALLTAVYMSYEGARNYSPAQYIANVLVPNVSSVTDAGTVSTGLYEWTVVESEWTTWHVARADTEGKWLFVVESKKADVEKVLPLLESISGN